MTGRFRVLALLLTAATLQATLFDEVRVDGVAVEYLLLVAVLAGHHGGPERGAVVAFFAGLLHDSVGVSPLGLHALAFAPVAVVVGHLSVRLAAGARGLAALGLLGSVAAGVAVAAAIGTMFGLHPVDGSTLLGTALVAALMTGTVALPTSRIVRWAVTGGLPVDIDMDREPAGAVSPTAAGRVGRR
ncbi:MAG: rod shape-determining protein MreD [Acidimicrobiaceae bacterium]|nr:rod shape-determining protein MreD [Acidimicrobiaceae bacterium]